MDSYIKGKHILAVDDEKDILETIEEILEYANVDCAENYQEASRKIAENKYDLAIFDIMGVNGIQLLEKAVKRDIPAVMLTAHAVNPESLIESIRRGAIAYLPKETLADLDILLNKLLEAYEKNQAPWKLLFEELGDYFDQRFGTQWKEKNRNFWSEFDKSFYIGRGIQTRVMQKEEIRSRGI